ncbi:hypothetical protein [Frateuria aurantia]|uniref:Phage holin n=1 Tax=Frateuria aurantia (strain ATCC 33424 / DSM 6220 / KCTC 2777 / LMG 1558 / NBRC 3245 / NCIMB 13370) TaxID=767434 RepID=H8L657_FRAAD|nr:hypothetical protein [Frateuria aurantia]AFC85901.1 hypothetical protein Fraau_1479 [Frateuria aurantia DSM 6220]
MSLSIFASIGVRASAVVAGFAGSVVHIAVTEQMTRARALAAIVAGTGCAAYLPDYLVLHYQLPAPMTNSIAFVCGLCGLSVALRVQAMITSAFHGGNSK